MENKKDFIIVILSDKVGRGDDALGRVLMRSYIYSLGEAGVLPKAISFLNSGVFLTTDGSPVLKELQNLADMGVEILSCGTCLDFFGLNDHLLVGKVTNMYANVDLMNHTEKTIVIS